MPLDTEGRPPPGGYTASGSPPSITFPSSALDGVDRDACLSTGGEAPVTLGNRASRMSGEVPGARPDGVSCATCAGLHKAGFVGEDDGLGRGRAGSSFLRTPVKLVLPVAWR